MGPYPDVVVLVAGVAHRELGDHLCVVRDFGGWADAGGSDVADAAALDVLVSWKSWKRRSGNECVEEGSGMVGRGERTPAE
jgi:hypothetical protein